jgi:dTMP kinase
MPHCPQNPFNFLFYYSSMAYPFIVLEGIDGSGKATQSENIIKWLRRRRQPTVLHKYPTENAKKVHEYLNGKLKLDLDSAFYAFVDDLQAGQQKLGQDRQKAWVISDRYCISTAAYQGVEGRLDERIAQLEKMRWIKPDMVIWLDLPVDEAMKRKAGQKAPDLHEANKNFLQQVRSNFDILYRKKFLCSNFFRVDASQPKERVFEAIRTLIERNL